MALHPLKGSERQPLPGAKSVGKADPAERLEVSVLLRRRSGTVRWSREFGQGVKLGLRNTGKSVGGTAGQAGLDRALR